MHRRNDLNSTNPRMVDTCCNIVLRLCWLEQKEERRIPIMLCLYFLNFVCLHFCLDLTRNNNLQLHGNGKQIIYKISVYF